MMPQVNTVIEDGLLVRGPHFMRGYVGAYSFRILNKPCGPTAITEEEMEHGGGV